MSEFEAINGGAARWFIVMGDRATLSGSNGVSDCLKMGFWLPSIVDD